MYVALESRRFHSGVTPAVAPCGVWQNTHTCVSLVDLTLPVPVMEKLWRVLRTSDTAAMPCPANINISSAAAKRRHRCRARIGSGFAIRPPAQKLEQHHAPVEHVGHEHAVAAVHPHARRQIETAGCLPGAALATNWHEEIAVLVEHQ